MTVIRIKSKGDLNKSFSKLFTGNNLVIVDGFMGVGKTTIITPVFISEGYVPFHFVLKI